MIYHPFQELQLSALGFGTMRLPLVKGSEGVIDQEELDRMVDLAMAEGVNYFDTAHPYHGGASEVAIGKSLSRYPRDQWYLADKFPGHQNIPGVPEIKPQAVFEEQLERCGVEYFDFYLLHNVNENSMRYYCDPNKHCLDYFLEQRALGRIRYLGFSCHAGPEALKTFLDRYAWAFSFCQIQLNFLDWKLQDAKKKCELIREAGLPIWVMEPLRGGKLAAFPEETEQRMHALRPAESIASWGFRWLQTVPRPDLILSGMSDCSQMADNTKTFSEERPLNGEELALLEKLADQMAGSIPCTACRYCCAGCPAGLNIPLLMNFANELKIGGGRIMNLMMRYSSLDSDKRADSCIACGQCSAVCPQKINVPVEMAELAETIAGQKTWEEVCRERAAGAAEKNEKNK